MSARTDNAPRAAHLVDAAPAPRGHVAQQDRQPAADGALWGVAFGVAFDAEAAQINLNTRLGSLLAVLESTVRARRTVRLINEACEHDKALRKQLSAIDQAYAGGIEDDSFDKHLGEVLMLARGLCADVSEELTKVVDEAHATCSALRLVQQETPAAQAPRNLEGGAQ